MTAPWQPPWISTLLARRELARLALDILVRSLLVVGACEIVVQVWGKDLSVFRGLWPPLAHMFLLGVLIPAPLYWLAFRPAAERAARAAAVSAGAQFQAVVEAVTDALLVSDSQGQVLFANPAAGITFGCLQEALLGRPLADLLPAQAAEASPKAGARFRAAPPERQGRRTDGTLFPAEVSVGVARVVGEEMRVTVVRDITRRKKTEQELERLASFPRLNPTPVLECDAAGRVTYANPVALHILQGLEGPAPVLRLLPPDLPQLVRRCLEEGSGSAEPTTVVNARTLLWSFHPLPDRQRVRLYAADITERQEAERRLEERTAYLNALIENSPLAIVALDPEHRVEMVNPAFERLFGYSQEEALGSDLDNLIACGEARAEASSYTERVKAGETVHVTTQRCRKDGSLVDVELHGVPLLLQGQLVGVYALYQDVTERRRAEEALRESEERFRRLVEALPVAVRVIQAGRLAFTNPAGAALYGYKSPEEMRDVDAFAHVSDSDAARLREYVEKRVAGEEAPTRYEFRARRRGGAEFPAEAIVARITYKKQPASLIVVLDLTERKRLRLFESLLPVCCQCGKVRDDKKTQAGKGSWRALEEYVVEYSDADLTHTFCPNCYRAYREKEGLPPGPAPESD